MSEKVIIIDKDEENIIVYNCSNSYIYIKSKVNYLYIRKC